MKRTTCAAIAAAFLLAGCSGEPSEGEIEESVGAFMAEFGKIVARTAKTPLRVDSVEKHGCTLAQGATYVCDITMTISGGHMQAPSARTAPMKFTKTDAGWIASE